MMPPTATLVEELRVTVDELLAAEWNEELPVAGCPGWSVADLLAHLCTVESWVTGLLTNTDGAAVASGRDLAQTSNELLDALLAADPNGQFPSMFGPCSAQWWANRQAIEHATHLWDLKAAHGQPFAINPATAARGIDEWFDYRPKRRAWNPGSATGATVHLHATDGEGEWLATIEADGLSYEHTHGKGDLAVRGSLSDLLMLLWGRLEASQFEVFGNPELLDVVRGAP